MSCKLERVDAKENGFQFVMGDRSQRGRLPPHSILSQYLIGVIPNILQFGLFVQLLVVAQNDDTKPVIVAQHLVDFDTDFRVHPHPLDLLSDGGEAIEVIPIVSEIKWYDIRLPLMGAP